MENDARHQSRASVKSSVDLKLYLGPEVIDVRLDEFGIHFSHPQGGAEGHLPWDSALAMSLLPPGVTRGDTISAA